MHLFFTDREAWRAWLEENHDTVKAVWLVFLRKHTGRSCLSYDTAVEEALCFGWIDCLIKRLDDDRYMRKFTPRKDTGTWSATNIKRVDRLIASGRMTGAGLAKIDRKVEPETPVSARAFNIPRYFEEALAGNESAFTFFSSLAPSYQRQFVGWVDSAKREETRLRRLEGALSLLERGEKLGMK